MKTLALTACALFLSAPAFAAKKDCNELKSEIDGKLKAKGVQAYQLDVVPADQAGDARIVGSCDGGAMKIVYKKG